MSGSVVGEVGAEDSDGVQYRLLEEGSSPGAVQYFTVDPDSGVIRLVGDLASELYDEYRLAVEARDGGQPSLASTNTLNLRVQQVQPPAAPYFLSQLYLLLFEWVTE